MALSRVKVWIPGDILTASDLNGEFNNILNNPISLISPTTGAINFQLQAHSNLIPSAITASSGNDFDVLTRSTSGTVIWSGSPSVRNIDLHPGAAIFSTGNSPTLLRTTDSNWPTYTLLYHSTQKDSAYWYVQLTTAFSAVSTATMYFSVACTSSGGASVWQVNSRTVAAGSTWNVVGSTNTGSTFTIGNASDISQFSIPLTASSWTPGAVIQIRIDRTTDAGNTSTGLYLHHAALKMITV